VGKAHTSLLLEICGNRNEVNSQIVAMLAGFFNVELFKAKWLE
jgi:hypothetical protein